MEGSANERLDFGKMGYGCKHYRRRCKIRAPCCNEVFDCRHCHNESTHSWAMCSNYEISAKSNYNFEKPFLHLARKLAGHEAELAAAASQPLLDDDDDAFD